MVPSSLATIACPKFGVLCVDIDPSHFAFASDYPDHSAQPIAVETVEDASQLVANERIPVVVCREDAPGGGWETLLQQLQALQDPPKVIVYCTRPDSGTWAKILTCGGFDVVSPSTPPHSIFRTLRAAYERRSRQLEVDAARKTCARALTATFAERMYA